MSERVQSASCPEPEILSAFADGMVDERMTDEITLHLARCNACLTELAGVARFREEGENESAAAPALRPRVVHRIWTVAAIVTVGLLSIPVIRAILQQIGRASCRERV